MDLVSKVEEIKQQTGKSIFTASEVANYLGVTENDVFELVECGSLKSIGNQKDKFLLMDLISFEYSGYDPATSFSNQNQNYKFSDLAEEFFLSNDGVSQSRTFNNNFLHAKHILDAIGHLKTSDITKDVLQRFLNGFSNKKYYSGNTSSYYSQSAINKVYDNLRGIVRYGVDRGIFPFAYLDLKKPTTKKYASNKVKPFTDSAVITITNIVSSHQLLKTYIFILLYTGMRPSEALALKKSDINFEEKTISIERTLSYSITTDIKKRRFDKPIPIITNLKNERKGKKLCRLRILKVSDLLLHVIREWIDYVESNDRIIELKTKKSMKDFLFCGVDGQLALPEYYFQIYKRQLSKNGYDYKDFNLYRFRHNFCTRALRQGIEPKIVQALMGDETLEMVLRVYDTINDSEILKASGDFAQNMDYTLSLVEPST